MSKLFISCDEATTICDKNQYGEATIIDKLKLNLHFLRCKICKMYTKQNTLLSRIFGVYSDEQCAEKKCLSPEDKQKIEKQVAEKLN
jgi:hypothetical protein